MAIDKEQALSIAQRIANKEFVISSVPYTASDVDRDTRYAPKRNSENDKKRAVEAAIEKQLAEIEVSLDRPVGLEPRVGEYWDTVCALLAKEGRLKASFAFAIQSLAENLVLREDVQKELKRGLLIASEDSKGNVVEKENPAYKFWIRFDGRVMDWLKFLQLAPRSAIKTLELVGTEKQKEIEINPFKEYIQ